MAEQTPYGIRQAIAQGHRTGIFPIPSPSGFPKTSLDPSVDDLIDESVQEIMALPDVPYPSAVDVAVNHPGVAGYQVLTDEEFQNVNKYDMLMRRLRAIQGENPSGFQGSRRAMALTAGADPEPVRDRSMWAQAWGTPEPTGAEPVPPYRHRGWAAPGQPVRNAMELWMAPFSAVANNVIRPMYDLDKAAETQPAQLNVATAGLSNLVQGKDMNPAWSEEREFSEAQGPLSPAMILSRGNPAKFYQYQGPSGTVDGIDVLTDLGYPDHWSRTALGMLLEAPFDPATASLGLIGKNAALAARAATPAARNAALRQVGANVAGELWPPAAWAGALEGAKAAQGGR